MPVDGIIRSLPAGGLLKLDPGESVTLMPGDWHAFWGEGGDVLIGEVSTVNDDLTDNVFGEPIGRFSTIEEDVAPSASAGVGLSEIPLAQLTGCQTCGERLELACRNRGGRGGRMA